MCHVVHTTGDVLESRGSLLMKECEFTINTAEDTIAVMVYRADRDGSFLDVDHSNFTCPKGFRCKSLHIYCI